MKTTRKGWVRKLDKLVSQTVIKRDKKCLVCGTTQNLTCGHLFSRVAYSTRWDLRNCYAQCLSCNLKHEYDPYPMIYAVKGLVKMAIDPDEFIDSLHRIYVTPHKYKTYELEELYKQFENGGYIPDHKQEAGWTTNQVLFWMTIAFCLIVIFLAWKSQLPA